MLGHDNDSCDYLIRHALVAEHICKDPTIRDRIFKKHECVTRRCRENSPVFQNNNQSWINKSNLDDRCHSFVQDIIDYNDEANSDTDQN